MNVTPLDKISNQIPSSGKFLELTSLFLSFFAINFTNWASNFGGYEVICTQVHTGTLGVVHHFNYEHVLFMFNNHKVCKYMG